MRPIYLPKPIPPEINIFKTPFYISASGMGVNRVKTNVVNP